MTSAGVRSTRNSRLTSSYARAPKRRRTDIWQNHGDYKLEDFVARAGDGWHHSTWDERIPIHVGPSKVHLKVKFSRWRKDGSLLSTFETIYIVTLQDGHWGVQARSSFAS